MYFVVIFFLPKSPSEIEPSRLFSCDSDICCSRSFSAHTKPRSTGEAAQGFIWLHLARQVKSNRKCLFALCICEAYCGFGSSFCWIIARRHSQGRKRFKCQVSRNKEEQLGAVFGSSDRFHNSFITARSRWMFSEEYVIWNLKKENLLSCEQPWSCVFY